MSFPTLLVQALLVFIALFIGWYLGRNFPADAAVEKLVTMFRFEIFRSWYINREWKCVQVITDYPGPFGSDIEVVILEDESERIMLCRSDKNIVTGTMVRLRQRRSDESWSACVSLVDSLMLPVIISDKKPG